MHSYSASFSGRNFRASPRTLLGLQLIVAQLIIYVLIQLCDQNLHWSSPALKQLANFLPALVLYGLLLGLTRRIWTAALLTTGICLLIFNAHSLKLEHLNQPLQFADIFLFQQTLTNWDLLSHYAPPQLIPALIVSIIIMTALLFFEKSIKWVLSLPLAALSISALYTMGNSSYSPDSLYGPFAHDSVPWASESVAEKQGLIASLTSGARSAKLVLPEPDRQLLDKFLEAYPPSPVDRNKPKQYPDIILWLSESFFDPGIIEGVSTCEYLPKFCELRDQHPHNTLDIPTFGGNTTRTEFEVLTSVSIKDLGIRDYPYISIVHKNIYSIAWALHSLGYETTAIHPNRDSMWQRNRALPLLGFNSFISRKDFNNPEKDGIWISDAELMRQVEKQLQKNQQPQFIFAISMEGHGPFSKYEVLDPQRRDSIPALDEWNEKASTEWREFIYHAQNASRTISILKERIMARERDTLVVFFGDHLPNLKNLFDQVKFKNGKNPWEQASTTLAFANYPMTTGWLPDASHELGVWTLDLAGVVEETKFKILRDTLNMAKDIGHKNAYIHAIRSLKLQILHTPVDDKS